MLYELKYPVYLHIGKHALKLNVKIHERHIKIKDEF